MGSGSAAKRRRRKAVYDESGGVCWYCGGECGLDEGTIEHLEPKKGRGEIRNRPENMRWAHHGCNSFAGARDIEDKRHIRAALHNLGKEPWTYWQALRCLNRHLSRGDRPAPKSSKPWRRKDMTTSLKED